MPQRHYFTHSNGPCARRQYPWADMLPGDYLIDHEAIILPCGIRWHRCKAYNAAKAYESSPCRPIDDPAPYFTGRVEHDENGDPVGVRVTRELGQFMRSNESMWKALRDILTNDEFLTLAERLYKQTRAARRAILRAELERRLMPREHSLL